MYLRNLYPTPKSCIEDESVQFTFGASVTAVVSGLDADTAERAEYLWYRFSCDASVLKLIDVADDCFRFTIGDTSCTLSGNDSYALHVDASGVCVIGKDAQSLMDGIKTLVQLICPEELAEGKESLYISAVDIHDTPDIGFRALHICVFPDSELYTIEKAIHMAGFLKLTHVILEFWGTFPYACSPSLSWADHSFSKEEISRLVTLTKSYGMEVIPMVNHFGHASQSRGCYGRHVTLNQAPRMSRLFEPDGWTWCLSNPDTYKLLAEMRAEQMDLCGDSAYFHLGFDEALSFATCDKCRKRVRHELLAEFLNRLIDDVCAAGRRPIIWHDQLIRRSDFPEGNVIAYGESCLGQITNTYKAIDLLDRRVIVADWQYSYTKGFNPTTSYFMEKGFDTVVCPFDNTENIRSLASDAKKLNTYGIILTTWHHLMEYVGHATVWTDCVWGNSDKVPSYSMTDNACILRRIYDVDGDYEKAGWKRFEIES